MRSGFFNSNMEGYDDYGNPIYDRAEEASFFAEFFASFIGNGIYPNPSTGMQVLANSGMNLKIQPGKCFINGYFGLVEEGGEIITIEQADENYNRIDRVVARWDLEIRKIIPFVLKGMPASNPVAPSLTRNSNIYEIALADVTIKANTTAITQANITDRRLDTSLCGIVTGIIEQVDTTTLFNQYQTWFEERKQKSTQDYQEWFDGFTEPSEEQFVEWFEGIKNRLGEDVATNLQVQVDQLKEDGIIVNPTEPENDRRKVWFQKGKNLLDLKYAKELTSIDVSTGIEIYSDTNFCGENYISVIPNTVYTISSNKPLINIRLSEYTNEKVHIQRNQEANSNSLTIITNETTRYLRWSLNIDNSSTITVNRLKDLELQLEQEGERTEYEAFINPAIYIKNDNNTYEEFTKKEEKESRDWTVLNTSYGCYYRKIGNDTEINLRMHNNSTIKLPESARIKLGILPLKYVTNREIEVFVFNSNLNAIYLQIDTNGEVVLFNWGKEITPMELGAYIKYTV